ncbi:MAG: Stigma-specific protein Stig1, partial [Pseudomonadota bacterium]
NFECFDTRDLFSQDYPNQTHQVTVLPGQNDASIACLTTNGTQSFAFSSCAIETQSSTELMLDCGCTYSGNACSCAALSGSNLQNDASATCVIDASAPRPCAVVCCSTGLHACSGACVNLQTDTGNCGTCGHACTAPTPYCVSGACSATP